jgi:hypothetical protein
MRIIDAYESGDVYEIAYITTSQERPYYSLLEQRQTSYADILDLKFVVKTKPPFIQPTSSIEFDTQYGYTSIKSNEFTLNRWGRSLSQISIARLTLDSYKRMFGEDLLLIRSVSTQQLLQHTQHKRGVTSALEKYLSKIQYWKIEYIVNPYSYPYVFAVIQNVATNAYLTVQRYDEVTPQGFPSWCDTCMMADNTSSRKAIVGDIDQEEGKTLTYYCHYCLIYKFTSRIILHSYYYCICHLVI